MEEVQVRLHLVSAVMFWKVAQQIRTYRGPLSFGMETPFKITALGWEMPSFCCSQKGINKNINCV